MNIADIGSGYATEEWLAGADAGKKADSGSDVMGRDQFLKLLVTQLQNQDPLNPMDGTGFSAQLAQFSSLEQLFNVNDALSGIQQSLAGQGEGNILDYIGKNVMCANDNTIFVNDGHTTGGTYSIDKRADITVKVYDGDGFEVCALSSGWKDAGQYSIDWNGMDRNGDIVGDGEYTCSIEARDKDGYAIPVLTSLSGEVTGVTYKDGDAFLMIGDNLIAADDVTEVSQTGTE